MKTSSELERSPCVILLYAYGVFNIGACAGYVASASVCFSLKFYMTLVLLVALSAIVLVAELANCARRRRCRQQCHAQQKLTTNNNNYSASNI